MPLVSLEAKADIWSPLSLVFRGTSLAFMGYMLSVFLSDEKAVGDLKEFTSKGISDLFDYSKEWDFGKLKLGGEGQPKGKTFKDKYKQQMKTEE